ncbi:MAG: RHS repeat-associated core domain-containing protein [Acidobacteriota bacterium]
MASTTFNATTHVVTAPMSSVTSFFRWLFGGKPAQRHRETLNERLTRVASLQISPAKFVGYQGQSVVFSALPLDNNGQTVQGARLSWSSSDAEKLIVDDSGTATLLQPGQAQITCRAGVAEQSIPVLIRPGNRPTQTDADWDADQRSLTDSGVRIGSLAPLDKLMDKFMPTVNAQNNYCPTIGDSSDFGYDELYSESRNLVGNPRYRALEPTLLGNVQPEGSNFNMAMPLYGLSGRGLGASLTLFYNSRIWSRHGSAITFNAVNSSPSPGFSLNFGRILTYGSGASAKYVLIDPDGTRHYLGTGSDTTSTTYQTTDGTHITFVGSKSAGGKLYFNNGTAVTISVTNNRLLPTKIKDANGNYVSIGYKTYNGSAPNQFLWRQAIDYLTDSMGRYLQFNYDTNMNLSSITAPNFSTGTRTVAQFDYECRSISASFSGLTVENAPSGNIPVLKHVYFPATNTGYKFDYSVYGMVYKVTGRKDMSIDANLVIADGTEKNSVEFNYPTTASSLTDAPSFSQRAESATSAPTATYTYSSSAGSGTATYTITRPDSSKLLLTRSTTGSNDGLMTETQIQNASSATMAKTEFTYTTDGGSNKQVQTVTSSDDATPTANQIKVDFDYDSYGNVTNTREYGYKISGVFQVRRRTHVVYKTDTSYLNAYLRSLVIETDVYDALENTNDNDDSLLAKATFTYDDYASMGGMEVYSGQSEAPNHDATYDATKTVRGNVTGVTRYKDVGAGTSITRKTKYDKYGNVVKQELGCCNEQTSTLDGTNAYTAPVSVTKGTGTGALTSTMEDDFNTGLVISATDPRGEQTTVTYDAALRPDVATYPTTATSDNSFDDANLTASQTVTYDEGANTKTVTTSYSYDGWGRVITQTPPGVGAVTTTYDAMGRVWKRSNPYQAGVSPTPETVNSFDALGRATQVSLPGGNTVQTSYSGATVTVTDQVNRQMKRELDGLGRLIKVTEQDVSSGSLNQETSYSYDLLDNLKEVNQGSQYRKFKYDSLSRMLYEKIPEQTASINDGTGTYWTTKYTYTDFDAVDTKTDARGVITTYSYDTMNRLTGISYNVGSSGVPATPSVSYTFDNGASSSTIGLLLSVSLSGQSSESYSYDSFGRLSGMTATIGAKSYTTSYSLNEAGQATQMTYPSTRALNLSHDAYGRLLSIVNNSDSTNYLSSVSYTGAGQVSGWTLGSNINESFGYDSNRLQLTSQTVTQNGFTRLSLTYSYAASSGQNGNGSTAGNSGQLMSISGSINGATESASYTYDNLGRLVTSNQTTNSVSAQRRFVYDRWGNRTSVYDATSGGTQIQSISLTQSGGVPTNQISSVTTNGGSPVSYTYDANGNVTNDGSHTYQYDAENRVVSVDSGATATYAYDHQNQRIKKVVGSTTTHYVWQGGQCIAEHNGSTGTVVTDYIFSGSRMIARESSGSRLFFLYDRLSVRATITDGQGSIQGRQAHLPFGEELNTSGTTDKHKMNSYERDTETGNDYAVNRDYSANIGRFNQSDPYEASGYLINPQSWNRYAYVENSPVDWIDPEGLKKKGGGEPRQPSVLAEFEAYNPGLGLSYGDSEFSDAPTSSGEAAEPKADDSPEFKNLMEFLEQASENCKKWAIDLGLWQFLEDFKKTGKVVDAKSAYARTTQMPGAPRDTTYYRFWMDNYFDYATGRDYAVAAAPGSTNGSPYGGLILLGNSYYYPQFDSMKYPSRQYLQDAGNNLEFYQAMVMLHELMHVKTAKGHDPNKSPDDYKKETGFNNPGELINFFKNDCK